MKKKEESCDIIVCTEIDVCLFVFLLSILSQQRMKVKRDKQDRSKGEKALAGFILRSTGTEK